MCISNIVVCHIPTDAGNRIRLFNHPAGEGAGELAPLHLPAHMFHVLNAKRPTVKRLPIDPACKAGCDLTLEKQNYEPVVEFIAYAQSATRSMVSSATGGSGYVK